LKHPELSPQELCDIIISKALDSDSDENESSDSETAEEDKYYTVDVSKIDKNKIGENKDMTNDTSDSPRMAELIQMITGSSLSDREAEWAKVQECIAYPVVYFVTQKGYLGRGR
jgi:hypothetical protein